MSDKNDTIKIRTCRICLNAKSVDMVLLDEQNGWFKLFEYCFGLTLTIQDEPRLICNLCADKVQDYVQFKEKCHKSHILWQSVISDVKCSIVKHNVGNTNYNVNDPIATRSKIENECFDASLNNNFIFCIDDNTVDLPNTEIKEEIDEDVNLINEKSDSENDFEKLEGNDCVDSSGCKKDSKQKISDKSTNNSRKTKVKKVYTCVKCKREYGKYQWYVNHIDVCRGKVPKKCSEKNFDLDYAYDCGRNYNCDNVDKIKNEFRSDCIDKETIQKQNQDNLLLCGLCRQSFSCPTDVCKHLNEHWSNNDLVCKLCDFVGIDLAAIAAHRFSHYPRTGKIKFLCHICGKSLNSLLALHFHYRSVHLKKAGGYCSRCNKEFTKLRHWKKHERTHSTPRYICDICGKKFFFKTRIREHMMSHDKLRKCICDTCGNFFSRSSYLKLHIETVHTKSEPIKCTHCNRMYKSQFSLNLHHKIIAKKKSFKCEVCHKGFITPNVLKSHMVMHSNERPYCCEVCGASYKAKSQLKVHMIKHTGILRFKCLQCLKEFATSQQLKVHSSVHTGIRRHSCIIPNCVRTFHSKKLMLAHLALRHKNENGGLEII